MLQFSGQGFRAGLVPCNRTDVYWFFTWSPPAPSSPDGKDDVDQHSPAAMKQFVLTKLRNIKAPPDVLEAVERSEMNMNDVLVAPLRYRPPLSLLFASISKGNVCVAGDALHPTTPDLAQGACVALEDAVVLARCLGDAIAGRERETVEAALRRYAGIRRWRSGQVIAASYVAGLVHQSDHAVVRIARDRLLSGMLAKGLLMMPDYDCGTVRCELSGLERELGLLSVLSLVIRCQTVNLSMYSFGRCLVLRGKEGFVSLCNSVRKCSIFVFSLRILSWNLQIRFLKYPDRKSVV